MGSRSSPEGPGCPLRELEALCPHWPCPIESGGNIEIYSCGKWRELLSMSEANMTGSDKRSYHAVPRTAFQLCGAKVACPATSQTGAVETAGMTDHHRLPGVSCPRGLDGQGSSSQIGDCLNVGSGTGFAFHLPLRLLKLFQ